MLGLSMTAFDWISLAIAFLITIYLVRAKNPYEKGTDEHQALRLCRVGLGLLVWSFGAGLVGIAFALTAFILGIIGIVKGRTAFGVVIIIGSVCMPILSFVYMLSGFMGD